MCPVSIAGNLIEEEKQNENYDESDSQPKTKKKKSDSLNSFYTIMAQKKENKKKRHEELLEIQNKSLQLQKDAITTYTDTMKQLLDIYKNK